MTMMMIRKSIREASIITAWAMLIWAAMIGAAAAADATLHTDLMSRFDPALVGAFGGFAGGTIRAMRADVLTSRAMLTDAVPGMLAGAFAWPVTLAIFGPLLATLQTTADVVLTLGAKVGVASLLTGVCLSLFIGLAETIFSAAQKREGRE